MAIFDPEVGDSIQFEKKVYVFVENPNAPGMVHSSEGGFGYIYKMKDEKNEYALKQFKPDYRQPDVLGRTKQLSKFKDLGGMWVVDRLVVTPDSNLVQKHQDLRYSIIMPWIRGKVWSNYLSKKIEVSPTQSISLAQTLVSILAELERRQSAHCDLSSGNLVIEDDDFRSVQLIDIEDMYSPEFEPPKYRLLGSPGYTPDWIQNEKQGTYCQEGDRFAGAVLLAEILCWHSPEIRQISYNESSYFDPREVGKACDRYTLLNDLLRSLDLELSILFDQVWFSNSLQSCPTLLEWEEKIKQLKFAPVLLVKPSIINYGQVQLSKLTVAKPTCEIIVKNVGNAPLTGELACEPWIFVSPNKSVSLLSGEQRVYYLGLEKNLLKPKKSGVKQSLKCLDIFSNGGFCSITAKYTPLFPILHTSLNKIDFGIVDHSKALQIRKIRIVVSNKGDMQLVGKILCKPGVVSHSGLNEFFLDAKKSVAYDIFLDPDHLLPPKSGETLNFDDAVVIETNDVVQKIAVQYSSIFPEVTVDTDNLDFGIVDSYVEQYPQRQVVLQNIGSLPFYGEFSPALGFSIMDNEIYLEPGEKRVIIIEMNREFVKPDHNNEVVYVRKLFNLCNSNFPKDLYVSGMYKILQPELEIFHNELFFDKNHQLNLVKHSSPIPSTAILIRNRGGGKGHLFGDVFAEFPWITVSPSSFELAPGQCVEVAVSISGDAPIPPKGPIIEKKGVVVRSTKGVKSLGFTCGVKRIGISFILPWIILPLLFLLGHVYFSKFINESIYQHYFACLGLAISFPQWLVLRRTIPNKAFWVIACGFFWFVSVEVSGLLPEISPQLNIFIEIIIGLCGGLLGWLTLRKQVQKSGWMIIALPISFVLGAILSQSITDQYFQMLLFGLLVGSFTGIPLLLLMRKGLSFEKKTTRYVYIRNMVFSLTKAEENQLPTLIGEIIGNMLKGGLLFTVTMASIYYGINFVQRAIGGFSSENILLQFGIIGIVGSLIGGSTNEVGKKRITRIFLGSAISLLIFGFYKIAILQNWFSAVMISEGVERLGLSLQFIASIIIGIGFLSCAVIPPLSVDKPNFKNVVFRFILSIPLILLSYLFIRYFSFQKAYPFWSSVGVLFITGGVLTLVLLLLTYKIDNTNYDIKINSFTYFWVNYLFIPLVIIISTVLVSIMVLTATGMHYQIDAKHEWQTTSTNIREGDKVLIFQLSGKWSAGEDQSIFPYVDGRGYSNIRVSDYCIQGTCSHGICLYEEPLAGLIARETTSDTVYWIGRTSIINGQKTGYLQIRINDCAVDDNNGEILVWVLNINNIPRNKNSQSNK